MKEFRAFFNLGEQTKTKQTKKKKKNHSKQKKQTTMYVIQQNVQLLCKVHSHPNLSGSLGLKTEGNNNNTTQVP